MPPGPATRAFVVHPDLTGARGARDPALALEEAVSLARALDALEVVGAEVVSVRKPRPGYLFGTGKTEELAARFAALEAGLVIVDGPLTPVQQRNLEKAWAVKILDRTGLILEIFAARARTREGVLQVELAALNYQKTRLVRSWTHLERQRGGLGFVGGPGETQIEADRRALDEAITRIRRQLSSVTRTRSLHRDARRKVPYPVVALVGYTNAGKSTLFNRLTGAEVLAKDMLFATLDPTMRALRLPTGREVILSDTVGFISELPTQLVAAFRATLEEVLDADLIVHVRDISHPDTAAQARDVLAVLDRLGVTEERSASVLEAWNKIDRLEATQVDALRTTAARSSGAVLCSAMTGEGLGELLAAIETALGGERHRARLTLSHSDGDKRAWLYREGVVLAERESEAGPEIEVLWSETQAARYRGL